MKKVVFSESILKHLQMLIFPFTALCLKDFSPPESFSQLHYFSNAVYFPLHVLLFFSLISRSLVADLWLWQKQIENTFPSLCECNIIL